MIGMKNVIVGRTASALWAVALDFLGSRDRGVEGVAAIEFAVITPTFVLALICASDLGLGIYRQMQVQDAAQFGAEYAVAHGFDAGAISAAVSATSSFPSLSVSPPPAQYCGCPTSSGVTVADCGSSCPSGGSPGTYVTVSTQGIYKTILSYPVIPSSFTFSNQATVRIQ